MSIFTLEPELGVAYFKFNDAKISRTVEINDFLNVDIGADGKPVGIEFLKSELMFHSTGYVMNSLSNFQRTRS